MHKKVNSGWIAFGFNDGCDEFAILGDGHDCFGLRQQASTWF